MQRRAQNYEKNVMLGRKTQFLHQLHLQHASDMVKCIGFVFVHIKVCSSIGHIKTQCKLVRKHPVKGNSRINRVHIPNISLNSLKNFSLIPINICVNDKPVTLFRLWRRDQHNEH
jgi:hypothetical protein